MAKSIFKTATLILFDNREEILAKKKNGMRIIIRKIEKKPKISLRLFCLARSG